MAVYDNPSKLYSGVGILRRAQKEHIAGASRSRHPLAPAHIVHTADLHGISNTVATHIQQPVLRCRFGAVSPIIRSQYLPIL